MLLNSLQVWNCNTFFVGYVVAAAQWDQRERNHRKLYLIFNSIFPDLRVYLFSPMDSSLDCVPVMCPAPAAVSNVLCKYLAVWLKTK